MSYDVYFWHQATGDIDEVLEELADQDVRSVVPHPSVRTFRRTLLAQLPHLIDVIEPEEDSSAETSYLVLTLPFHWVTQLPEIMDLSARHGLSGWDPQMDEPLGRQEARTRPSPALKSGGGSTSWTAERLSGLGLSKRSITRAWSLAELPQQVSFGEAVGAYTLAMAIRDGVSMDGEEARRTVAKVAADCAHGVPRSEVSIEIGFVIIDVTGYAGAIARGGRD